VANLGFWKNVHAITPFDNPRQSAFGVRLAVALFSVNLLVSCLFLFRPIVKWWQSPQLLDAAIRSYFILTYGVVIETLLNVGGFLLAALLLVGSISARCKNFSSLMRNNTALRHKITPLNALWGLEQTLTGPLRGDIGAVKAIGDDAKQTAKSAATQK
jgi:glucan phosphoethanolaminetransferase (alkaline phosphatase superfamily)